MVIFKIPKFHETPRKAPVARKIAGMTPEEIDRMKWSVLSAEDLDAQFTKNDLVQILNYLGVEHDKRQLKPELIELLQSS